MKKTLWCHWPWITNNTTVPHPSHQDQLVGDLDNNG